MSRGLGVTRSALAGVAMRCLIRFGKRSRGDASKACLIRFGKRWRGDASKALIAFGLEPPSRTT